MFQFARFVLDTCNIVSVYRALSECSGVRLTCSVDLALRLFPSQEGSSVHESKDEILPRPRKDAVRRLISARLPFNQTKERKEFMTRRSLSRVVAAVALL